MHLFLQIRAALRIALVALVIGIGALLVLLLSLLPWRIGGAKIATWPVVGMAWAFLRIMGIRYRCPQPERVRHHAGLIFCNHTSFLDIVMILALTPARFLSTKGVRKLPIIGQLAVALDTIFIHRYNDQARAAARDEIVARLRERQSPPLALFPEGKIGPGHTVLPLRYGSFEIAKAEGIAILPCVLIYEALAVVSWYERADNLIAMAWQMAMLPGGMVATLVPLDLVQPQPEDDIPTLVEQVRLAMQAALDRPLQS